MERYMAAETAAKAGLDGIPALIKLAWDIALILPEFGDEIIEDLRADVEAIVARERERLAADAQVAADAKAAAFWRDRYARTNQRAITETAELVMRSLDAGMNPHGYYVYLLWPEQSSDKPAYVGRSLNVFSRLGDHMTNPDVRYGIRWITTIDCGTEDAMIRTEARLIGHYQPPLNTQLRSW